MLREEQKAVRFIGIWGGASLALAALTIHFGVGFNSSNGEHWAWFVEAMIYGFNRGQWANELVWIVLTVLGGVVGLAAAFLVCPYSFSNTSLGKSRWAVNRDLKTMPFVRGSGFVLGRKKSGPKLIADLKKEARSELIVAPAGAGKTQGRVLPTLYSYPGTIIVTDPKNELYDLSAGWRRKCGEVHRITWRAEDAHFNPIARNMLPDEATSREIRIDAIAAVLVPVKEGGNTFFDKAAQGFLATVLLFLLARASAKDTEASIGEVLDWLSEAPTEGEIISVNGIEIEVTDPMSVLLNLSADEANTLNAPPRVAQGLREIANMNMKTRSDVIGTLTTALNMFKNSSVRAATSDCSFTTSELRGPKPVTIYVSMSPIEAGALSAITGLLVQTLADNLLAGSKDGMSVLFLIEEFPQLGRNDAIKRIFEIGRGQRVHAMAIAQDFGQIREKYGQDGLDTFMNTSSFMTIFSQNSPDTREKLSRMIGDQTQRRISESKNTGGVGLLRQGSSSASWEGRPLVKPGDLGALPMGENILLVQNHHHHPIYCTTEFAYRSRSMRKKMGLKPQ